MVEGNEGTIALEDRCIYITINVIYSLHVSYFGVAMTKYLVDTKKKMIFLNSRCQRSFHLAGSPWQNRVTPLRQPGSRDQADWKIQSKTQPPKTHWEDLLPPQAPFYCSSPPNDAVILRDMKGLIHWLGQNPPDVLLSGAHSQTDIPDSSPSKQVDNQGWPPQSVFLHPSLGRAVEKTNVYLTELNC